MKGLFAFYVSWLIGYYFLRCFKDKDHAFDLMDCFVVTGLGLGLSGLIVFYTLIFSGHVDHVLIILAHLICLSILFFLSLRFRPKQHSVFLFTSKSIGPIIGVLVLATGMATILALLRPWGDWDGWSYWNYRASFIFNSGYDWTRMFEFNIQEHHPWMLPLVIIWGWVVTGGQQTIIPIGIGIIFTVSTVGLLIGALRRYISSFWSAIGGLFLVSIPIYLYQGTSQYADIEAAYFILLSSLVAFELLKAPTVKAAALTGLCLGLTAAVKDNSIVAACILLFLILVRLVSSGSKGLIKPLCMGFISIGITVLIMKLFSGYYNSYNIFWPGLLDGHKWVLIGHHLYGICTGSRWGGFWPLAFLVFIVQLAQSKREGVGFLVGFIFLYIIFYFLIFAACVLKLEWLLSVSLDRLLFLVAPTVVFLIFYTVAPKRGKV